jgi:hypothetical protein
VSATTSHKEKLKQKNFKNCKMNLDEILEKLPKMSLYAPLIADLHFGDNHPINLQLVSL